MLSPGFLCCQTSVSDLRMTRSDVLRWDIHPFITHKRACMPKCALEKVIDFNCISLFRQVPVKDKW